MQPRHTTMHMSNYPHRSMPLSSYRGSNHSTNSGVEDVVAAVVAPEAVPNVAAAVEAEEFQCPHILLWEAT